MDELDNKQSAPLSKDEFLNTTQGAAAMASEAAALKEQTDQRNKMDWERSNHGRVGVIGLQDIQKAATTLEKYKEGKQSLENKIIENEDYWKKQHWNYMRKLDSNGNIVETGDPEPTSAWLVNMVINKHADFMDNEPEINILAQEESDKEDAKILSSIVPVILRHNDFGDVYSDEIWYKIVKGTGVFGVFWNKDKAYGIGDIDIKRMDLLNLFWQPGIRNIQDSRNLFYISLVDNDLLKDKYPDIADSFSGSVDTIKKYNYNDTVDTSDKSMVVDWYYKKWADGQFILHYCQFCGDNVLYATENDPYNKNRGLYDHGKYPFDFDVLFPEEGTPTGFGYVDMVKQAQKNIDKLNAIILKNAYISAKKRYFAKDGAGINMDEFNDITKDIVHCTNLSEESIREIVNTPLSDIYVTILNNMIEELKETSGNRDVSSGGTTGGATAASAIAAMQEAGSKASRDAIKTSYRSFERVCNLVIELIRQFYTEERQFRIVGDTGAEEYIRYSNEKLKPQRQGVLGGMDMGSRLPVFDLKAIAAKKSAFSKIAQNELAKEIYGLGGFNPQMSDQVMPMLNMMDFEGIEAIKQDVAQNGQMLQQIKTLQELALKLASALDQATKTTSVLPGVAQMITGEQVAPSPQVSGAASVGSNPLGESVKRTGNTTADKARQKAQNISAPK